MRGLRAKRWLGDPVRRRAPTGANRDHRKCLHDSFVRAMKLRLARFVALISVVLVACSQPDPMPAPSSSPTAAPVVTKKVGLSSSDAMPSPSPTATAVAALPLAGAPVAVSLPLGDCAFETPPGIEVECGFVTVPADYRDPTAGEFELQVAIFRSPSPIAADVPVVYLEGRPGRAFA